MRRASTGGLRAREIDPSDVLVWLLRTRSVRRVRYDAERRNEESCLLSEFFSLNSLAQLASAPKYGCIFGLCPSK